MQGSTEFQRGKHHASWLPSQNMHLGLLPLQCVLQGVEETVLAFLPKKRWVKCRDSWYMLLALWVCHTSLVFQSGPQFSSYEFWQLWFKASSIWLWDGGSQHVPQLPCQPHSSQLSRFPLGDQRAFSPHMQFSFMGKTWAVTNDSGWMLDCEVNLNLCSSTRGSHHQNICHD